MEETFETYQKRTKFYTVISCIVVAFFVFVFTCILAPKLISNTPQPLMVILFLLGFAVTITSMFLGNLSIKTYISDGQLMMRDVSISINENTYPLTELLSVEVNAGSYKGRGTRGGLSDGTGNKIMITTKALEKIETKFVVSSKVQRDDLTEILKFWKAQGFKIISNGIDLV